MSNVAKFATVETVREQGCKVNIFHLRRYWVIENGRPKIDYFPACVKNIEDALPTGGITAVKVTTPDGKELVGFAECSNADHYNRRRGVRIALNRALHGSDWLSND